MRLASTGNRFDLSGTRAFRASVISALTAGLKAWYGEDLHRVNLRQIAADQVALRAYPNLDQLRFEPQTGEIIEIADETENGLLIQAEQAVLGGRVFVEHSAGGDATRLGMGAKYLLSPLDLAKAYLHHEWRDPSSFPLEKSPNDLLPISLGNRHMLQFAFDIEKLARQAGLNPSETLKDQVTLSTLNVKTAELIIRDFVRFGFFGLSPENTLFMIDETYPGLAIENGELKFSQASEFRLYNHGHMVMQETMPDQIFYVTFNAETGTIERHYLTQDQVQDILGKMANKVSTPIEDNDYLTQALDLKSLALALQLSAQGYRMVMEVVRQKQAPLKPQKGGFWAYDPTLQRGVMIETDSGGTVIVESDDESLRKIALLNRNVNLFPKPVDVWSAVARQGLPLLHPIIKKDGFLAIQPPQGDQNFLVLTAFIRRQTIAPINNLKELKDVPTILTAMAAQDAQDGFAGFARSLGLIK